MTPGTGDFGALWNVAVILDIINTLVVVYFVWRIWTEKPQTRPHSVP